MFDLPVPPRNEWMLTTVATAIQTPPIPALFRRCRDRTAATVAATADSAQCGGLGTASTAISCYSRRMICPNCGSVNEPGRKFCGECATRLVAVCPSCGSAASPSARFCGECGTSLAATTGRAASQPVTSVPGAQAAQVSAHGLAHGPVAERRIVSILFADLVGFTTLAEGRDPEETRELLTRYFDLARDVVERYGGAIEKFIGDAVMAVWGAPTAHEDDAERAVRAALELVDAVKSLGPIDPGPGRRPDRRGRGHPWRHQPGHGRRRPGQHRQPPPVGGRARARSSSARRPSGPPAGRSSSRRPASRPSRASRPRSRPGAPCVSWPSAAVATEPRHSRRRSSAAMTSCACSRTCSTPRAARSAPAWCR